MLNLYKKLAAFEDVFVVVVFASLNTFSVECDALQLEHEIVGDAASKRIAYPHRSHGAVILFLFFVLRVCASCVRARARVFSLSLSLSLFFFVRRERGDTHIRKKRRRNRSSLFSVCVDKCATSREKIHSEAFFSRFEKKPQRDAEAEEKRERERDLKKEKKREKENWQRRANARSVHGVRERERERERERDAEEKRRAFFNITLFIFARAVS